MVFSLCEVVWVSLFSPNIEKNAEDTLAFKCAVKNQRSIAALFVFMDVNPPIVPQSLFIHCSIPMSHQTPLKHLSGSGDQWMVCLRSLNFS